MKISDFVTIANVIDLMLAHWEISAVVLLALTVIFIGLFGGFKKCLKLIIALVCIGGLALAAVLIVRLARKEVTEIIAWAIAWVPTVLFVLILLISVFVGYRRGLRKSLILFIHSLCAAALCISLYFVCISLPAVDELLLSMVNGIMGEGGLQSALGVSGECTTIRQVFYEFVLSTLEFGDELQVVLSGSGAYVMTLVDLCYRLAFTVVCYLLYFLLIFILYIIYHACYSERKYKRKKNLAFTENKTDCTYKKRRIGGGVVGLTRGLIVGLISMSFLGSTLFIIAGGTGDGKLQELEFKDKNTSFIYSVYRSVESYGAQGIYKVLNFVKDTEDTPYYLFAADLIFSGGLDDEKNGISENIKFRKELGAYTGFARETLSLLMKYGEEELLPVINGEATDDGMSVVLEVMSKPEFQAEFTNLVDNFDAQTYFINFGLSLVDSVVSNIDSMSFADGIGEGNKELLKVMFKQGYLSNSIPDERERREKLNSDVVTSGDIPPYISVNKLLTKRDVQTVLEVALSFLAGGQSEEPLEIVKNILPEIEKLSIFGTERAEEMDPVLGRMYCLLENVYLTEEGQEGLRYSEVKNEKVSWGKEIRSLIGVADELLTLYDNVYAEGGEPLDMVLKVFDKDDEHYSENIKIYDNLCEVVSDSKLVGRVLSSGFMTKTLKSALSGVSENIYIPAKIAYANTYDEDGKLIARGEAYQLFYGLRLLGENKELLDELFNSESDVMDLLDKCAEAFEKSDAHGNKLSDYAVNSVLLRSLISSVITEQGKDVFAVPSTSLETDENKKTVNLINAPELKQIFDVLPHLIELIKPLTEEEVQTADIVKVLDDETLNNLLDSGNGIIEGTVANLLIEQLGDGDVIVIPQRLKNFENWVTFGAPGELRKLLSSVKALELDYGKLIDGDFETDEIFETLNELDRQKVTEILHSDVIHYTLSDYLLDGGELGEFEIIVPSSVKITLRDDVISSLINREELVNIITDIKDFGLNSEMSANDIVKNLITNKHMLEDSVIISASIVNFMLTDEDIKQALDLPQSFLDAGERTELENYSSSNIWYGELPALVTALDEIFDISAGGEFEINDENIKDKISDLFENINSPSTVTEGETKLTVMYSSEIIKIKVTKEVDVATEGKIDPNVRGQIKKGGVYTQQEIERLVDALNELGINKLDGAELENKDFSALIKDADLDVIYSSRVAAGIITYSVYNDFAVLKHDDRAYESGIQIYKQEEIRQLLELLGEGDIKDYQLSSVSVLKPYIAPNAAGEPSSYIIAATVSGELIDNDELKIPSTVKDGGLIKAQELVALIDAFSMLSEDSGEGKLDDWQVSGDMKVPDEQAREAVLNSVIMRATLTDEIIKVNEGSTVTEENVDVSGGIPVLSETQLRAVFTVISLTAEDGNDKLVLPKFENVQSVRDVAEHIDELYECDFTRYLISDLFVSGKEELAYMGVQVTTHFENVIFLYENGSYSQPRQKEVADKSVIESFLAQGV